jgi:hypothetical protein
LTIFNGAVVVAGLNAIANLWELAARNFLAVGFHMDYVAGDPETFGS